MYVGGSGYIEVAEVTGAEGGVSESVNTAESRPYIYPDRQSIVSKSDASGSRGCDEDEDANVSQCVQPITGTTVSASCSASSPPDQPLSVHVVDETAPSPVSF